jgi:hypothetical protein
MYTTMWGGSSTATGPNQPLLWKVDVCGNVLEVAESKINVEVVEGGRRYGATKRIIPVRRVSSQTCHVSPHMKVESRYLCSFGNSTWWRYTTAEPNSWGIVGESHVLKTVKLRRRQDFVIIAI